MKTSVKIIFLLVGAALLCFIAAPRGKDDFRFYVHHEFSTVSV